MANEKEYRLLTGGQFGELVKSLPEVRGQIKQFPELIKGVGQGRIDELLGKDFSWACLYELTLDESLAFLFVALGLHEKLRDMAASSDPQQAILDWANDDSDFEWSGGINGQFEKKHVIGAFFVLQRNILSIMLYHRSVCDLVRQVRESEDWRDPFFKAVRVDRSVMSCPTFADRISRAELEGDRLFFDRLRSALKGPQKKHWEAYRDLRYAFCVLRELGFNKMSDAQLEDLLVHQLKVYPDTPSARKNLRKQYTESKRVQPPKNAI